VALFKRKAGAGNNPTRLFYASDIHGSEPTFRKFLTAARFYQVDALVFGGDLMGKLLVPIVRDAGDTWRASLQGHQHHLTTGEELAEFKTRLDTLGFYSFECDPEEYRWYEGNQERIDAKFDEVAKERLAGWVQLAEERLAGTHVRVYLCGGNDDTDGVLSALEEAAEDRVVNCENRIVELDDEHVLATYQPTVGLHGHIHESRGAAKFGRTPAFNPGSEYGEGILRGLIVAIRGGEVVGQQFTSG
jgi:Icc-related predicted phosphoesterase